MDTKFPCIQLRVIIQKNPNPKEHLASNCVRYDLIMQQVKYLHTRNIAPVVISRIQIHNHL